MSKRQSPYFGLLFSLLSVLLVLGGSYTALHENRAALAPRATPTPPLLVFPSPVLLTPGQALPSPVAAVPTETIPPPASCPPPAGWVAITVQSGETLEFLAQTYHTSVQAIKEANCLSGRSIPPGALLYVPPASPAGASPTPQSAQCGPPPGWVFYTVQPGENLFRIGLAFGVEVSVLQWANCLGNTTYIRAGQRLYVPNRPTRTPSATAATATVTPTSSAVPTETPTPPPATLPPTETPSPTATPSPQSATPTPPAETASPTLTPTPTAETPTPTPAASTDTPTPTATSTPVPTSGTDTPEPTSTSTWTPTPSPTLNLLPTPTP